MMVLNALLGSAVGLMFLAAPVAGQEAMSPNPPPFPPPMPPLPFCECDLYRNGATANMKHICLSEGHYVPKDQAVCTPTRPGFPGTNQDGGHYGFTCDADKTLCVQPGARITVTVNTDYWISDLAIGFRSWLDDSFVHFDTYGSFAGQGPFATVERSFFLSPGTYFVAVEDFYGDGLTATDGNGGVDYTKYGFSVKSDDGVFYPFYAGMGAYQSYHVVLFTIDASGSVFVEDTFIHAMFAPPSPPPPEFSSGVSSSGVTATARLTTAPAKNLPPQGPGAKAYIERLESMTQDKRKQRHFGQKPTKALGQK